MRRVDEPIDPHVAGALDAIDATLAGEPVDPEYADLAELALLLRADRATVSEPFSDSLDRQVASRFVHPVSERPRRWFISLAGLGAAAVAGLVAIVVVASGGGVMHPPNVARSETHAPARTSSAAPGSSISASSGSSSAASSSSGDVFGVGATTQSAVRAPQPPANGRKIVQSANLQLTAAQTRIEDVAQEVFDVVGRESGVVRSSMVSAGPGGYAQFQLSIPSGSLGATMAALSNLRYAQVASRTDVTEDVNNTYVRETRRLADDRALRSSLLRQLASAATTQQIKSLNARIHDADAAIARDEASLRSLNNKVNFSQISVEVNASAPALAHHRSGGFTLGKAAHDAGRVLMVGAGVALIGLAVLVPLALVGALGLWIRSALRRRRREQALDMA